MTPRLGSTGHLAAKLAMLLIVSLLSGTVVPPAGAQPGSIFSVVPSPSPTSEGNVFNAVVALSPGDAWAVGFKGSSNVNESRTLIEHWDGSRWTVVSSPNPGSPPSCIRSNSGNVLTSVAAVSSNDIWAVGYFFTCTSLIQPLILHWNGTTWTTVPNPQLLTNDNSALNSVVALASNDVWAVGYQPAANGAVLPLIEHWDGSRWTVMPAPTASPTGNVLAAVSATGPTDIWAVGYSVDEPTTSLQTLTMHFDGAQWSIVPSPNVLPKDFLNQNILSAVKAVAPDDVTAVGHILDFDNQRTLTMIQHWDGTAWSVVPSPNPSEAAGTLNTLNAVTGFGSSNLYAAGHFANGTTGGQHRTMIQHWDGSTWTVIPSPTPARAQQLFGAFSLPGTTDVWAVGGWSIQGINAEFGLLQLPRTLVLFSSGG
jgi:hypothetical protein